MNTILNEILENSDENYKLFQSKLIPTIDKDLVLGLRAPRAMAIAKKYANTEVGEIFLSSLPHKYYDENIVHAFMLGKLKAPTEILEKRLLEFLPYVDNWAVCDGLVAHLKEFYKERERAFNFALACTESSDTYTIRFGLVSLLSYYVDSEHIDKLIFVASRVKSTEYYVNMANAWLISFMLVKEYEKTLPILTDYALDEWVHNKAIRKAIESFRISDEQKSFLKTLRR